MMKVVTDNLHYVKNEVDKVLSTSPLIIRKYTQHLLKTEGKYLRAYAVLVSALRDDMSIDYDAVKFAAAIEILHLASLVHDDVMDDADMRRGNVTLHKLYGRKTAIICGDYLLAIAMSMANSIEDKEKYLDYNMPDYMEAIALGELKQHINNGNVKLKMKDYLEIIEGKTAKLFEASLYAGAVTSNEEDIEAYKLAGHHIGMIFQLLDDVSDFEDTQEKAKKPVQSDYEQGVITLPLIHAFEENPELQKRAETETLSRKELQEAVTKAKGVEATYEVAEKYYAQAVEAIESLQVQEEKRQLLMEILNKAMRR